MSKGVGGSKFFFGFYIYLATLAVSFCAPTQASGKLEAILGKCAEYSEKLLSAGLYFVCEEHIKEEIVTFHTRSSIYARLPTRRELHKLSYDYQLIKKEGRIEERRTLIAENGKACYEPYAHLKTKRFYSLKSVYGPVGILSQEAQELYHYELINAEKTLGRRAYVLVVSPKGDEGKSRTYGTVWIDAGNGACLKLKVAPEAIEGYELILKRADEEGLKPILSAVHEYGIEKNGIRFPSRTLFEESYSGPMIPEFMRSRVLVEYSKYRFFTVEVQVR